MSLPTGPVWKLPAMRNGHSNPHSSALISVWALTSGQLLSNLSGCSFSDVIIQQQKHTSSSLPLRSQPRLQNVFCLSCPLTSNVNPLIMSKSMTHPLVQYVSKQQCLKMELPYPLALQIVKTDLRNFLDIGDGSTVQLYSAVVHCFSILQLPVHTKQ